MSENERVVFLDNFNPFTCPSGSDSKPEAGYFGDAYIAHKAIKLYDLSEDNPLFLAITSKSQHSLIPIGLRPAFTKLCLPDDLKGVVVPLRASIHETLQSANVIVRGVNDYPASDIEKDFFSIVMDGSKASEITPPSVHFIAAKDFGPSISSKAVYDILHEPVPLKQQLTALITEPAAEVLLDAREVALEMTGCSDFRLAGINEVSASFNAALGMALKHTM